MKKSEQIKVIKELVEGVDELNGEHQEGWDETIQDGKKLIVHLEKDKTPPLIFIYILVLSIIIVFVSYPLIFSLSVLGLTSAYLIFKALKNNE